jgi:hypothetical protein
MKAKMMDPIRTTRRQIGYPFFGHVAGICLVALGSAFAGSAAFAAEKPALNPDPPSPLTTTSRVSATLEFGLPALAAAIERDIPKRLATIDEEVNCDSYCYIDRTGGVSLYGRDDRVIGAISIDGVAEGQGANRFTARIHGETEASATVEAEARPQLRRDWSLDLHFSDSFRWSEPPFLHVLGRDISLAKYAEPRILAQLAKVRARADAAARKLDLQGKAAAAWQQAFQPIQLADEPQVWLQLTPQSAAFAGVRANSKVLSGSLELAGSAGTFIGQAPPAVTPTALPPLGTDITAPGSFDIILPVRVGYDTLRDKVMQVIAAAPKGEKTIREVQIYPSSGKLVVGLRVAKASDTDASAGEWTWLSSTPSVDPEKQTVQLSDLAAEGVDANAIGAMLGDDNLLGQLKQLTNVSYGVAYQNLLIAANQRLTRPLKDGFRMEGNLTSAKLEKVSLLADGLSIALHASGDLKILYRM